MPRNDDSSPGGVSWWVRRWWRALVAELVSTALLVWLGLAALVPVRGPAQLAHVAMAFGFVIVGNAIAFGPVSGAHMNPAVTLAAALQGRLRPVAALAYFAAQMLGGLVGFGALLVTLPATPALGVTRPAPGVGEAGALVLEAVTTGLLALACCAAWAAHDAAKPDPAMPIKLGLLVAGLIYSVGEATGASLNPARSFAPALFHGVWESHWVYWLGPLGGAALAALFHRYVLLPSPSPASAPGTPRLHEELPLADKP